MPKRLTTGWRKVSGWRLRWRVLFLAIVVGAVVFADVAEASTAKRISPNISGHLSHSGFGRFKNIGVCGFCSDIQRVDVIQNVVRVIGFQLAYDQRHCLLRSEEGWGIKDKIELGRLERITITDGGLVGAIKSECYITRGGVPAIDSNRYHGSDDRLFFWIREKTDRFKINESAINVAARLICCPQNITLASEYANGYHTDNNQSARPPSDHSRPFSYFIVGIICIAFGICFAWYGAGYQRGDKYEKRQYILESLISFGLILISVFLIGQGGYLIFLASADRRAEDVGVLPIVVAELKLRDVQRQVFLADLVIAADDAALN